jgi:hypothetical protein
MKLPPGARLAQVCVVNAVPLGGIFLDGWSTATALVVYWFETLLATAFTAARIAIHRKQTHKAGHYFGGSPSQRPQGTGGPRRLPSFLSQFVVGSLLLTVLLGLFLGLLLGTVLRGSTDLDAIRSGFLWMAVAQLVGFAWDLRQIGQQPFAWVQSIAKDVMGRIMLLHLGMLAGMFTMGWFGTPPAFFGAFALMKLAADLIAVASTRDPTGKQPQGPPGWLVRGLTRLDPEGELAAEFRDHLARARERESARTRADEEGY